MGNSDLHILWTNDNPVTSQLMVLFYATNSLTNRLWESVNVILWGASVKMVVENEMIQEEIKTAQHVGVKFTACTSCARRLGAVERLEELGIEIFPWTEPFTDLVKNGEKLIYM